MDAPHELDAPALCWHCDLAQFEFQTTEQLEELDEVLGQQRALDAVEFGIGIRQDGYNLYVLGPPGTGKRTIVERFLEQRSASQPRPSDWCYVENFVASHKPKALQLPAGRGAQLRQDADNLVEDLRTAIPAALEIDEHQNRIEDIQRESKQRHDEAFHQLAEKSLAQGIQLIRTPAGFAMAPVRDGEVMKPEEFDELSGEEKQRLKQTVAALEAELQELLEQVPQWRKETRDKIKQVSREATSFAIRNSLAQFRQKYHDLPQVLEYFDAVQQDVTEHADQFHPPDEEPAVVLGIPIREQPSFQRYRVNVLVDNGDTEGAPVIYEDHPNHQNLLGRVEYKSQMGTLVTDFTLIKPGALHRANGGYLVVEALRMLQQPFAWEGLKRALLSKTIKIESLAESLSLTSTVSLEPEPIPLDVKVVLFSDRLLYYLLYQYDRDFAELFKVAADFEDDIDRSPETCRLYARLIATLIRRFEIRPFDSTAVARVIEHSARVAEDSEKLTAHMRTITDLLREADYWASKSQASVVSASHVDLAIDKQIHRVDRVRKRIQDEIQRGTLLIDTSGQQIGQVNGLSVLDLGNFRFGRPSRITATARLGKGELVDIEREVELGGAIHSKGVLIISALLATRYATNHPLSLSASLVFEQSYGMIDGDSASVAELCALMSALAAAPIKQTLGITGSVNQHGVVQPIGGVNEKIEGFFDVCQLRGLSGDQGVLIPKSNVKHLMLRRDVVQAVAAGQFHIYPVETLDDAITLLTGVEAGQRDQQGQYPAGSINHRVQARLLELFKLRQKYSAQKPEQGT